MVEKQFNSSRSSEESSLSPPILLGRMLQQAEVRDAKDDWTGRTNAAERRKLQNRLNQRIYRKCYFVFVACSLRLYIINISSLSDYSYQGRRRAAKTPLQNSKDITLQEVDCIEDGITSWHAAEPDFAGVICKKQTSIHNLSPAEIRALMAKYESQAYRDYMLGCPRTDQRLTLIQFNVFRALVSNTYALGFTMEWLDDDAISPFYSRSSNSSACSTSYPKSLTPTTLQKTTSHHPWIDLFPFPKMRDNMLLAAGLYSEAALCNNLIDFEDVTHDKTGLIVWKEPSDPSGWEVSEAFLKEWSWVVSGCDELVQSTNYWRAKRGERPLYFGVERRAVVRQVKSDSSADGLG
jgi:hypothetical protein